SLSIFFFKLSSFVVDPNFASLSIAWFACPIFVSVCLRHRFPNNDVKDLYQSSSDWYKSLRTPFLKVDSTIFISDNVRTPVDMLVLLISNASRMSSNVIGFSEK